jgi:hypothetical protein
MADRGLVDDTLPGALNRTRSSAALEHRYRRARAVHVAVPVLLADVSAPPGIPGRFNPS